MKNTISIEKISVPMWDQSRSQTLEIMKFWLAAGVESDIDLLTRVEVANLEKRMQTASGKSEAMASFIFSQKQSTKLIYCNEKYSPVNGTAHGIDLGHLSNNKQVLYVIEVKYTKTSTTSNFSKAKEQLLGRFDHRKPSQLDNLLKSAAENDYADAQLVQNMHYNGIETKDPNVLALMPNSLVPTALVVSHRKVNLKTDQQIFKVLYKLEPEM